MRVRVPQVCLLLLFRLHCNSLCPPSLNAHSLAAGCSSQLFALRRSVRYVARWHRCKLGRHQPPFVFALQVHSPRCCSSLVACMCFYNSSFRSLVYPTFLHCSVVCGFAGSSCRCQVGRQPLFRHPFCFVLSRLRLHHLTHYLFLHLLIHKQVHGIIQGWMELLRPRAVRLSCECSCLILRVCA